MARRTVLGPQVPISLTLSTQHDPDAYYRTGSGLYAGDDFRDEIVSKAKPVEAGTTFMIHVAELSQDATDQEIEAGLPAAHLFDESAVCAIVAEMIEKQKDGEPGDLRYLNLLYTRSCIVAVRWGDGTRRWRVATWDRDHDRWRIGSRVLSPAN